MKRTIVCIDGYNLYYGLLKGTKYKWLDFVAFASLPATTMTFNLKRLHYLQSAILSLALASFVFIVVPSQTYFGSPDLFDYPYLQLLSTGAIGVVAAGALIFVAICLLEILFGQLSQVLALALLVCLYLESGIFSIGLPPINGLSRFINPLRTWWDFAAWSCIILLMSLFYRKISRYVAWITLGIMILSVASVVDSMQPRADESSFTADNGYYPCYDIMMNFEYSTNRNVLVFILDMTPAETVTKAMEECPELKAKFNGFVNYAQNRGMHEETALALPGLMTGKYWGNDWKDRYTYGMAIYGDNSLLQPYIANNDAVYYYAEFHSFGYSNRIRKRYASNYEEKTRNSCCFLTPTPRIPHLRMLDVMRVRCSPYAYKNYFLDIGLDVSNELMKNVPNAWDDQQAFEQFAKAQSSAEQLTLGIFHTHGLHWPLHLDRFGHELSAPLTIEDGVRVIGSLDVYRRAQIEQGIYLLGILGRLFDTMRERGLYDRSTIIVAADHGCISMQEGRNHGAESPMLWVKPMGSDGPYSISKAPTTHAKIHDLVCSLRDNDLAAPEITKILSEKNRFFRCDWHGIALHEHGGELHYTDWVYDEEGNLSRIEKH